MSDPLIYSTLKERGQCIPADYNSYCSRLNHYFGIRMAAYEQGYSDPQFATVQDELPFCISDSQGIRQEGQTKASGGYIGDDSVWINFGSSLVVYQISSLRQVASWTVETGSVIAFVSVYKLGASDYALLLAVNGISSSEIYAFDILPNTAVQLFTVPSEVVCIEPVRWPCQNPRLWEDCAVPDFADSRLIIAVGTMQGHVYIFGKEGSAVEPPQFRQTSTWPTLARTGEQSNGWTMLVDVIDRFRVVDGETGMEYLRFVTRVDCRDRATGKPETILNESSKEADSSMCSALHFNQETMILVIGFNFGCVLLYHVLFDGFSFNYCCMHDGQEITGFCFVEPEESPRNVTYLVVSKYGRLLSGYFGAAIQIVDLQFSNRAELEDGTHIYSELLGLREGFSMRTENCGRFILHVTRRKGLQDEGGADTFSPSIYFLNINAHGKVFAIFFDLNSWYHAQTPSRVTRAPPCPFITVHNYGEVCSVLDVLVNPFMDNKYRDLLLEPEFTYYPCNYGVGVQLLTARGVVNCTIGSLQEQVFAKLEANRSSLDDPSEAIAELQRAGLIERSPSIFLSTNDEKRCLIWTAMLSAKRLNYLTKFASLRSAEGSLEALFKNWIWQCSLNAKRLVQEIAIDHLDYGFELVPDVHRRLCSGLESLETLLKVHRSLMEAGMASSEEDKARYEAMTLISLYVRVVTWFILQENNLFASISPCLRLSYTTTHSLDRPLASFTHKFTQMLATQVEGYIPRATFPPSSLEELLRIYLLPFLDLRTKHFAVFYVLVEKLLHCESDVSFRRASDFIELFERRILDDTDPSLAKYAWYCILGDHGEGQKAVAWLQRAVMFSPPSVFKFWRSFLLRFNYEFPLPQLLLPPSLEQMNKLPSTSEEAFPALLEGVHGDGWLLAKFFKRSSCRGAAGRRSLPCPKFISGQTSYEEGSPPANLLIGRLCELRSARYADFAVNQSRCVDALFADVARDQSDTMVKRCFALVDFLKAKVGDVLPEIVYDAPDVSHGLSKGDGTQLVPLNIVGMQQSRKRCADLLGVTSSSGAQRATAYPEPALAGLPHGSVTYTFFRLDANEASSPMTKRKRTESSGVTPSGATTNKQRRTNLPLECWAERESLVDLRDHRCFWDALLTFSKPRTRRSVELKSPSSLTPVLSRKRFESGDDRPSASSSVPKHVRFSLANEFWRGSVRRKSANVAVPQSFRRTRSKSEKLRDTEKPSDEDDEDRSAYADIIREIRSNTSSVQMKPRFRSTSAGEVGDLESSAGSNVRGAIEKDQVREMETAGHPHYSCSITVKQQSEASSSTFVAPQPKVPTQEVQLEVQSSEVEEEEETVSSVTPLSHSNSSSKSAGKEAVVERAKVRGARKRRSLMDDKDSVEPTVSAKSDESSEKTRNGSTRYYLRSLKKRRSLNEGYPRHGRR